MAVRCYESVEAFLQIAAGAGADREIAARMERALMPGTRRFDDELFGGRYFAATDGTSWTVLEAQPSASAYLVAGKLPTLAEARARAAWLANGPYEWLLSTGARELLSELAAAGHDGRVAPPSPRVLTDTFMLQMRERARFMVTVRQLRMVGFTVDQHVSRAAFKLHTPWAERAGVWPEDWHTIRGSDRGTTIAIAEGLTAGQARDYLLDMADTDGQDELTDITVETLAGLSSALDFLTASAV